MQIVEDSPGRKRLKDPAVTFHYLQLISKWSTWPAARLLHGTTMLLVRNPGNPRLSGRTSSADHRGVPAVCGHHELAHAVMIGQFQTIIDPTLALWDDVLASPHFPLLKYFL
jgi:hypothetical protein